MRAVATRHQSFGSSHTTYCSFSSRGDRLVASYHADHAYCFDVTGSGQLSATYPLGPHAVHPRPWRRAPLLVPCQASTLRARAAASAAGERMRWFALSARGRGGRRRRAGKACGRGQRVCARRGAVRQRRRARRGGRDCRRVLHQDGAVVVAGGGGVQRAWRRGGGAGGRGLCAAWRPALAAAGRGGAHGGQPGAV